MPSNDQNYHTKPTQISKQSLLHLPQILFECREY